MPEQLNEGDSPKLKREKEIFGRMRDAVESPAPAPQTNPTGSLAELGSIAREQREQRAGWWFKLPAPEDGEEDPLGIDWEESGRPNSQRWFKIVQVKPREQQRAMKLGKDDAQSVGMEMVFASLWIVGAVEDEKTGALLMSRDGFYVRNNRDVAEKWWKDIGPVGQALVQKGYMDKHQPSDKQSAMFLRSARRG